MSEIGTTATSMKSGAPVLVALGLAMFVYVIDTTIMGVSISALVVDLDTDVPRINMAITVYTLTMAAFMLTGAKLGDIWGARKAFRIGLIIYGVGTTITAIAPNIIWLLIGWSVLEGLGSALIVPAVNTLVRGNFSGAQRATAYGLLGGVAASGAALGPIIGGWITTAYTWRLAFAIEAGIVLLVLVASVLIRDAQRQGTLPRLDLTGVVLSVVGLGLVVLSIVQTQAWGWGDPRVWAMLAVGLAILVVFCWRSARRERAGRDTIIRLSILRRRSMAAGLPVSIAQTFVQSGALFVVPVFAQLVLGLNALQTGLAILPLSIAVMLFSVTTARLGHRIAPRVIIRFGLLLLVAGGVLFALALKDASGAGDIALSMFCMGAAIGIIAAQLPNLMLGGVAPDETSEAAGLSGTAQNLGMSLGTAVAGSVVAVTIGVSFAAQVADSQALPAESRDRIADILLLDAERAGTELEALIRAETAAVQAEIFRISQQASREAYRLTVIVMGLIGLLGYLFAFWLPREKLSGAVVEEAVRSTQMIPKLQLESKDLE